MSQKLTINPGEKYGSLSILRETEPRVTKSPSRTRRIRRVLCKCDCGNELEVDLSALKCGNTTTCGCSQKTNVIGVQFGHVTVMEELDPIRYYNVSNRVVRCQCTCGNIFETTLRPLQTGHSTSCGCKRMEAFYNNRKDLTTHGLSNHRLYRLWTDMKTRCNNPNSYPYARYGNRGISICSEWANDFMNFYNWAMANGYNENMTIDRIDNNGPYSPENCRWVTPREQATNKTTNIMITFNGKTACLSEHCTELGLNYNRIHDRITYLGWSVEQALSH